MVPRNSELGRHFSERMEEAFYDRGSRKFSEAPHLRTSILIVSHSKTDSIKKQITPRGIVPWSKYTNVSFF